MISKIIRSKINIVVFLLLIPVSVFSQPEANKLEIEKAITRAFAQSLSGQKCTATIDFATSSVAILFSKKGEIEKIVFAPLPECGGQSTLPEDLKRNLESLALEKKEFRNRFILAVLTLRKVGATQKPRFPFKNTFNEIDEQLLAGKELKYIFSLGMDLQHFAN